MKASEVNNLSWGYPVVILVGLLILGVTAGSAYSLGTNNGLLYSPVLLPLEPSGDISKVFTGKDAVAHAEVFIAKRHLTLAIKLDSIKDITFIGIAIRSAGNGVYSPAYYVVEGAEPKQYPIFQKKFTEFAKSHFRTQVSNIKIASSIQPNVNWNYAGTVDWITHSASHLGQKGYLELKGFYYYHVIDQNTVEYYARTKIRGDVSSSAVAVKDMYLHVSRGHSHEAIDDFLPDGHVGPTTSYQESTTVEFTPDEVARISASAGYSMNTNDGYYFRIDTHTADPNSYVDFHAYDFKKKSWWIDPPAWGRSFYMETAVTMRTTSTDTECYFGVFKYDAGGQFYFLTPSGSVIAESPEPIETSIFVYPPHTVFGG